jgi:arylsulfatase A-like enzyme
VTLALLAAAILALSCRAPQESAPNLLLVTVDTLRADHCSAYGYPQPTTANLDRVAAAGVRVDPVYAPMSITGPSHSTIFTGAYPLTHGVVANGSVLGGEATTLAEILATRGYHTAAVVSAFPLNARFGFAQGFAAYDDEFRAPGTVKAEVWNGEKVGRAFDRRADETTQRAIRWLEQHAREPRPFFLWVHYFDPHLPYDPPEPFRSRFAPPGPSPRGMPVGTYDGEISFADHEMGKLLDFLDGSGLAPKTLLVVTADHGEGLKEHGRMEHGYWIYEEEVRVPLVFRWPGQLPASKIVAGPAGLVDAAPTILELLRVPAPIGAFEGRSLVPALLGEASAEPGRRIYLQRQSIEIRGVRVAQFGLRAGQFKYIESTPEAERELYDLVADPDETRNLCAERAPTCDDLRAELARWRAGRDHPPEQALAAEDRAALQALGYVQ